MKNLSWAPLGALALAITALSPMVQAQTKSVAVTAIVEHPALDAIRDGVKAALKDAGYEEGKNLKWQYQGAQGNPGTAAQIARKFVGESLTPSSRLPLHRPRPLWPPPSPCQSCSPP